MIELTLMANLVVLLLIFLMMRTWLPLLKKKTSYLSRSDLVKETEVIITIPQSAQIQEQYSISPNGLSKKFENSVIVETFDSFDKTEESQFLDATLSTSSFINAFDLIMDEGGFIINIRCIKNAKMCSAYIDLICDQQSYEFLKKQIQLNVTLSLALRNAERFQRSGQEDFVVKGKAIEINLEQSEASLSSLRRFIKRYDGKVHQLSNSYLEGWYKKYKDTV
jgi:hypothetical protein